MIINVSDLIIKLTLRGPSEVLGSPPVISPPPPSRELLTKDNDMKESPKWLLRFHCDTQRGGGRRMGI